MNEKYNERYYLVTRDFKAYNPYAKLDKPIEIKRNSVIVCDGGVVEDMLKDSGYVEYLTDLRHFDGMFGFCLNTLIKVHNFRIITNGVYKNHIKDMLLYSKIKYPVFYWFDDYNKWLTALHEKCKDIKAFTKECVTKDIFGNDILALIDIDYKSSKFVVDDNDILLGFVENQSNEIIEIDGIQYIQLAALVKRICDNHDTIDDIVELVRKFV